MNINSTRIFSWKSAIAIFLGAGLLIAGLLTLTQDRNVRTQGAIGVPDAASSTVVAVVSGTSFEQPGQPVRISIPAIGVDAAIQSVGLSNKNDGAMGIPTNFTDVAWYNKGPLPGAPGNAVIAGHLDGREVPQAVFYDLGKLKPGDIVSVTDKDGEIFNFKVTGSKVYDYKASAAEVFLGDTSKARLNLITCGGDWIKEQRVYDERVVVFTELVEPVKPA